MKAVTVFYVPSCAFSAASIAFLALRGADFRCVNLEEHRAERTRLQTRLGEQKLETPTFEVEGELVVAPPLADLKRMLEGWDLAPSAAPHEQLH